jgi:tellurite resistance protein
MEFFPEVSLNQHAAEAIARALFTVAKVDGLHEREAALVASFWAETGGGAGALASLERSAQIRPAELASALHSSDERALFVKTAYLLAWADGQVTAEERKIIGEFGAALGVDAKQAERLEAGVKDYLLGHLSGLKNSEAAAKVASKLKV